MSKDTLNFPPERQLLRERIFAVQSAAERDELSLEVFRYQYRHNPIYRAWADALNKQPQQVNAIEQIPFLPISFFRQHTIRTGFQSGELIFRSSGTTGTVNSELHVADAHIYEESFLMGFRLRYGDPKDYLFIGLLPSYLERNDSSLVYMVKGLMDRGRNGGGFYLNEYMQLKTKLEQLQADRAKVWLIGVSFALLDFAQLSPVAWDGLTVLETGGMKGRRKEMIREELHSTIQATWNLKQIHSEYGMTELFSQAWTADDGLFDCPPWMKVLIREADDPLRRATEGKTGGIDVIDLANLDTCAFISTSDLGKIHPNGRFEVLGRFDHSEIRGCNLMVG